MRSLTTSAAALLLAALLFLSRSDPPAIAAPAQPTDIDVYFSPKGGCTEAVVREVNAAKSTLLIQAYSFTSTPIASAVAKAFDRGVKVTVVLDDSNKTDKYSAATYLFDHHIPTFIDARHAIAHNKVMVIDGKVLITGSFNFTNQAENSNAENMLVMRRPDLAQKYAANFAEHLKHSEAYARPGK